MGMKKKFKKINYGVVGSGAGGSGGGTGAAGLIISL
jgi:hypothetical protein